MTTKTVLLLFILFLCGCVPKSARKNPMVSQAQGGQDNGGGTTSVSSEQEVLWAYNSAVYSLKFFDDQNRQHELRRILRQLKGTPIESMALKVFYNEGNKIGEYLFQGNVQFENKASCPSYDKNHADASVSAHKIGADLCISTRNLMRLPKNTLYREILCLLIHEAAHMLGYGEADAQALQKVFRDELLENNLVFDASVMLNQVQMNLRASKQRLQWALNEYEKNPASPRLAFIVSEVIQILSIEMPYFKQPAAPFLVENGMRPVGLIFPTASIDLAWSALYLAFQEDQGSGVGAHQLKYQSLDEIKRRFERRPSKIEALKLSLYSVGHILEELEMGSAK